MTVVKSFNSKVRMTNDNKIVPPIGGNSPNFTHLCAVSTYSSLNLNANVFVICVPNSFVVMLVTQLHVSQLSFFYLTV